MTLQTVAVNAIVRATDLNQIINALTGVSNEPVHVDAVSNASIYALTVRNQGSGSLALMVQNSAGAAILQAYGSGVFASHDGSTAAAQIVNISATQTLTNKTHTAPVLTGAIQVTTGIMKHARGVAVASAAGVITLGDAGNSFSITGVASITGITIKTAGTVVTLHFASTAKLVKGSNLKIHSTFQGALDESITLISDGTNWIEVARSNAPRVQTGSYTGAGGPSPDMIDLDFTPNLVIISSADTADIFILTSDASLGSMRLRDNEPSETFNNTKIVSNGFEVDGSAGGNDSGSDYTYYAIGN